MGYYQGRRENPCPRCGGVVVTLFISVDMSFHQECLKCGAKQFTKEEEEQLGGNSLHQQE